MITLALSVALGILLVPVIILAISFAIYFINKAIDIADENFKQKGNK